MIKEINNKNNIHVLSRAVIIDQHHILLCETLDLSQNFYFLPGGHIEHGESAKDAVLREILEETGMTCKIERFLGCLEYSFVPSRDNKICHNHEYAFIFKAVSESLKIQNQIPQLEKHIKLEWMPIAKLNEIDFKPEFLKNLLPKWLDSDMNNAFQSKTILSA